jgi:hypothetical protein
MPCNSNSNGPLKTNLFMEENSHDSSCCHTPELVSMPFLVPVQSLSFFIDEPNPSMPESLEVFINVNLPKLPEHGVEDHSSTPEMEE